MTLQSSIVGVAGSAFWRRQLCFAPGPAWAGTRINGATLVPGTDQAGPSLAPLVP
jgi:hypothetical protein